MGVPLVALAWFAVSPASGAALPSAFEKTGPSGGAVVSSLSPTVTWGQSSGAARYEYCLDRIPDGICDDIWRGVGDATSLSVAGLLPGTTYSWQVVARNESGDTQANGGTWFTFRTPALPPRQFSKSLPADGAAGLAPGVTVSWTPADGATGYDYCVDTSHDGVCDGSWVDAGTSTSVLLPGLAPATEYSWQVMARGPGGVTLASGGWSSFTLDARASNDPLAGS